MSDLIKSLKEGEYEILLSNKIGTGSFSEVYQGHRTSTKQILAITNIIQENISNEIYIDLLLNNIEKWNSTVLENPYVLRYHDSFESESNLYIVTDYCKSGSLRKKLTNEKKISELEALQILLQIALGQLSIHEHQDRPELTKEKSHRNSQFMPDVIKPEKQRQEESQRRDSYSKQRYIDRAVNLDTIQFYDLHHIKVEVFGSFMQQYMDKDKVKIQKNQGPEYHNNTMKTKKLDTWNLGCIQYECLYGRHFLDGVHCDQYKEKILNWDIKQMCGVSVSENVMDLFKKCFEINPSNRISIMEFIQHPAFDFCRKLVVNRLSPKMQVMFELCVSQTELENPDYKKLDNPVKESNTPRKTSLHKEKVIPKSDLSHDMDEGHNDEGNFFLEN